ncbi:MAG: polysaccharide deacetylase family protein [Sphingomonas sp.]|uniref:polysaccharide deacetylase family protein n=1 Tax=Sphingomonas sp. TaxID=28214 RepID=UPI00262BDE21|nr:polysaccharide deacetylase family protein [Sphingomonas sp.]MDK2766908.1 polysaccharide deacetylase family protein [Sphingomonas sp.]
MKNAAQSQPEPGGYRPPAPPADAAVLWPDSFGTRFAVFVDTEEEFDWSQPLARENRGTRAMDALPGIHKLFADHGVPATYMIDDPIVRCARSVDILKEIIADGGSAIGSQLHPWVNPPHDETVSPRNSFLGNLPRALQGAKIAALTDGIADAFGRRPLMMRTGRYGLGPDTLGLLAAAGYRVDTSMRSGYSYAVEGGPDYRAIPNHAFATGEGDLIEIPLTTIYTGALRRGGIGLHEALGRVPRGRGIASRLKLSSRVALTPEDMPIALALDAIRVAAADGVRLLMFSYHSPSAAPGYTPYVRDAAELAGFRRWWERAFALLDKLGIAPASHDQILAALAGASDRP